MSTVMYLHAGEPIPPTYSVVERFSVNAIDPANVDDVDVDRIDVTTHSDTESKYINGLTRIRDTSGKIIFDGDYDVAVLALRGGGEFLRLTENWIASCETLEEHTRRAEAEMAMEHFDW